MAHWLGPDGVTFWCTAAKAALRLAKAVVVNNNLLVSTGSWDQALLVESSQGVPVHSFHARPPSRRVRRALRDGLRHLFGVHVHIISAVFVKPNVAHQRPV